MLWKKQTSRPDKAPQLKAWGFEAAGITVAGEGGFNGTYFFFFFGVTIKLGLLYRWSMMTIFM